MKVVLSHNTFLCSEAEAKGLQSLAPEVADVLKQSPKGDQAFHRSSTTTIMVRDCVLKADTHEIQNADLLA